MFNRSQTKSGKTHHGFSLIELMIALAIGSLISGMLVVVFVNVSRTNREQFKAAQQIENGRYAIDLLSNEFRLAGYYGEFSTLPSAGSFSSLPDPCDVSPTSSGSTRLKEGNVTTDTTDSPLAFYVQGYNTTSVSVAATVPTTCQTWINSASIKPGSDIIVVRRVSTTALINPPTNSTATPVAGMPYVQAVYGLIDLQYGSGTSIDTSKNARGSVSSTDLMRKDFSQSVTGSPATRPTIAAYIRALRTDIYYVSSCRKGSGANGVCTSSDDTIPTLKRLELTSSGGVATMTVVPLAEGVEFFKVQYGLDNGATPDGVVDSTVYTPASIIDWQNVVQIEIKILSRNTEVSPGYTDTKSYDLGQYTYTPSGSAATYRRHMFTQKVYLPNIGGRRET